MTQFPESVSTPDGKVKGSFSHSPSAVQEKIRRDRAAEALKAKNAEDAERERLARENRTDETAEEGEQPFSLPKLVDSSVYGKLSFEHFKEKYKSIFDQVRDKVHLTKGCVEFEVTVSGQKISLSSLTKGQQRFVNFISRGDSSTSRLPSVNDQEEFGNWFLLMAITAAGSQDIRLPRTPRISSSEFERERTDEEVTAFLANEKVQSKLNWLDDMANEVYQQLYNVATDIITATFLAVREDIVNP